MLGLASVVSSSIAGDLLAKVWLPSMTQLRYSNRPNLQRPLPLHYKRKRMLEVCKPRYPEKPKVCEKSLQQKPNEKVSLEDKPYHQFVVRELRNTIISHPMIAIFHANSYNQRELLNAKGMLFDMKFDMKLSYPINYVIARNALEGTKFEPMMLLVTTNTVFGYCGTTDVAKLLRTLKKMPQYILIGLVLENRLLHREDIEKVARLQNIDLLRGQLCATLSLAGQNLTNILQSNQTSLTNSLKAYSSPQQGTNSSPDEKSN